MTRETMNFVIRQLSVNNSFHCAQAPVSYCHKPLSDMVIHTHYALIIICA